jgi:hypothetical protein
MEKIHWHAVLIAGIVVYVMDGMRNADGRIGLPILGAFPNIISFPSAGILNSLGSTLKGLGGPLTAAA